MIESSEGEEIQLNGQQIMPQTQRQDSLDMGWLSNNNFNSQAHKEGADDQLWDDLEILFDMMEHDHNNGILV